MERKKKVLHTREYKHARINKQLGKYTNTMTIKRENVIKSTEEHREVLRQSIKEKVKKKAFFPLVTNPMFK